MGVTCSNCGTDNTQDSEFCKKCGTQIIDSEEKPLPTQTIEAPKEELTRGSTLADRYEIIEELGKGGMGRVFRVEDTKLKQEVALKLIKPEIAKDKKTVERFRNELKTARMIAHKNVCRMFDLGESAAAHFITMEYVRGEDLKSLIRKMGQLSSGQAISIAKQVCDGLIEAHSLGVVHRDLKPQNIMIDSEGKARIMDFGIARSLEAKGITGAGVMIGTPEYMSPEQVEGKETDQRSDIYSLGVILYEMVTGRVPFEGDTALSIAMKHKSEEPKDPREYNAQVSEDLSQIILRCLKKEKDKRYQSAGELRKDLENMESGIPTTERVIPERKPLTSREITVQFNLKKLLIPALTVIAIVIIGVFLWKPWKSVKTLTPSLSEKPSLAVLYFENNTGDKELDYLRHGLAGLITTDLSQSKYIRVLSEDLVYNILQKLSLLESERYSSEDLSKVAEIGGVNYLLKGSLLKLGEQFIITSTLLKPGGAEAIHSTETRCNNLGELPAEIDKLTQEIKHALDFSPEQIANDIDKAVGMATTSSPEAYKLFIKASEFIFKFNNKECIALLEKALEYDQDFVNAYFMLAAAYNNSGFTSKAYEYSKKTFDLRERLTDRMKYRIEGDFYLRREETYPEAIDSYKKLLELYPDDTTGNNMLGLLYGFIGEWDKAIEYRKVNVDNNVGLWLYHAALSWAYYQKGLFNEAREVVLNYMNKFGELASIHRWLADIYILEGKLDLALSEVEKAFALEPSSLRNQFYRADMYVYRDSFEAAEKELDELSENNNKGVQYGAFRRLAALCLHCGQYEDAIEHLNRATEIAVKLGEDDWIYSSKRSLIGIYTLIGKYEEANKLSQSVFSEPGSLDLSKFERKKAEMQAWMKTEMSDLESAQIHANELKRLIENSLHTKLIRDYYTVQSAIDLQRGDYMKCVELCRKALPLFPGGPNAVPAYVLDKLGLAYIKLDQWYEAKKTYENLLQLTQGRYWNGDFYVKSFYHLGTIFEKLGNTEKAIEHYEKFLDLWKDADPGIAEVDDAREKLAVLKNSP
jgi:serine/threonine protein kinase/Tfp pilus assembly protein PilF